MSKRLFSVIALLALVVAACGGAVSDETTTTEGSDDPVTTISANLPDGQLLSYSLEAGGEYQYEVDLVQHIEMSASGEGAAFEEEDIPGDAVIDVAGTAVFSYSVADGPDAGTYEVTIVGEFTDLEVSGTADGEPVDSSDEISYLSDFASMEPIEVTLLVDEHGNPIVDEEALEDPLADLFGDLGGLGAIPTPGVDPGQFVGPALADEEVTVGDTWTEEVSTPGMGGKPVVTTITSTVTGVEEIDGVEVYVIETQTNTSPIEFDLAELFIGILTAFGTPEGEDAAEFEAMIEDLKFLISIDASESNGVTYFDAAEGVARKYALVADTHMVMDMNIPDETTGEMSGFIMDMVIDSEMEYRLISGPTA